MNEIAFHTSPVINSKRPFIPQRKSREYQRPLLLLPPKRVPLSSHSFFPSSFLSLLLSGYSSFSPEWVFLSSLFSHPSLRLFLPVPTLSFTRIHLTERKRERERSEPVALRKILRCQPAGFKLASAPQGPLCAPPRSRRDLSWRTYL